MVDEIGSHFAVELTWYLLHLSLENRERKKKRNSFCMSTARTRYGERVKIQRIDDDEPDDIQSFLPMAIKASMPFIFVYCCLIM